MARRGADARMLLCLRHLCTCMVQTDGCPSRIPLAALYRQRRFALDNPLMFASLGLPQLPTHNSLDAGTKQRGHVLYSVPTREHSTAGAWMPLQSSSYLSAIIDFKQRICHEYDYVVIERAETCRPPDWEAALEGFFGVEGVAVHLMPASRKLADHGLQVTPETVERSQTGRQQQKRDTGIVQHLQLRWAVVNYRQQYASWTDSRIAAKIGKGPNFVKRWTQNTANKTVWQTAQSQADLRTQAQQQSNTLCTWQTVDHAIAQLALQHSLLMRRGYISVAAPWSEYCLQKAFSI